VVRIIIEVQDSRRRSTAGRCPCHGELDVGERSCVQFLFTQKYQWSDYAKHEVQTSFALVVVVGLVLQD
jgi:hypothetical protein